MYPLGSLAGNAVGALAPRESPGAGIVSPTLLTGVVTSSSAPGVPGMGMLTPPEGSAVPIEGMGPGKPGAAGIAGVAIPGIAGGSMKLAMPHPTPHGSALFPFQS